MILISSKKKNKKHHFCVQFVVSAKSTTFHFQVKSKWIEYEEVASSPRFNSRNNISEMEDHQTPSPNSGALSPAVGRRFQRHATEEDPIACTGKSCQSCTAGAIADCVAVCFCPCAVVNIFVLAFVKLPYAVARKCLRERRNKSRRRQMLLEERKRDTDGISEKEEGKEEAMNVRAGAEEIWLEPCEFGHLGFGRVSFTEINFHCKGS